MDNNNTLQKLEPTSELIASLEKLGMQVPEGATIVAAHNTPGVMNIVIPSPPGVEPLGDNALDSVAGGTTQDGFTVPGMALMGPFLELIGPVLDQYSAAQAAAFNTLTSTVQQAQSWVQDAQNG